MTNDYTGPPISDDGRFYYDGDEWLPVPALPQAQRGVGTIMVGVLLALIIVIAALWVINGLVHSDDALQCATENVERAQNGEPMLDCPQ